MFVLLITVLLVGFMAKKQWESNSLAVELDKTIDTNGITVPRSQKDLKKFKNDVNQLIQNNADKKEQELDKY